MGMYVLLSSLIFGQVRSDRQTERDAYEPTMQSAQVGSKMWFYSILQSLSNVGKGQMSDGSRSKVPLVKVKGHVGQGQRSRRSGQSFSWRRVSHIVAVLCNVFSHMKQYINHMCFKVLKLVSSLKRQVAFFIFFPSNREGSDDHRTHVYIWQMAWQVLCISLSK